MFRDTQEELERIQQQLLEEDDTPQSDEELLAEISALIGDVQDGETPNEFYNADNVDIDLDELSDEVLEEAQPESLKGLVIAACLLTLGIVAVLGWWILRLLG